MNPALLINGPADGAIVSIVGLPRELHYRDSIYEPVFTEAGRLMADIEGSVIYQLVQPRAR